MKLKPCPFCGGEIKTCDMPVDANTISYQFSCSNCGMVAYFDYLDKEESIEVWNRREPMDRIVEQLEVEIKRARPHGFYITDRRSIMQGLLKAIEIVKGGYEEVYREEYDTAGNYHTWGTQSGHTVVKKGGAV